jgi:DNA polymerase-4
MRRFNALAPPDALHLAVKLRDVAAQAIETREPGLRGRPFVVVRQCGDSHKSSVFSSSTAAKSRGVDAGMPVFIAKRRVPGLKVILRRPEYEETAAVDLHRILESITPAFSCHGRDLWLLDLTGTPAQRARDVRAFAESFRANLATRAGLRGLTIGISRSELLARVQAAGGEPDEICICETGDEAQLLGKSDARLLPGLSRACRARLAKYGLKEVAQIRLLGRKSLVQRFGTEGERLFEMVRGVSCLRVAPRNRSIFAETILDWDIVDRNVLVQCVRYTVDKLCYELLQRDAHLTSFAVEAQYSDGGRMQRSKTLARPTQTYAVIGDAAAQLFEQLCQRRIAIKSIRVSASRVRPQTSQMDLFESSQDRRSQALGRSIRKIRDRAGFGGILTASMLPVYERDPTVTPETEATAGSQDRPRTSRRS